MQENKAYLKYRSVEKYSESEISNAKTGAGPYNFSSLPHLIMVV
jgi:hypothetical protein